MSNFLSDLLDRIAAKAAPWVAGRLKLRPNELGGVKNAGVVAEINGVTQPVVEAAVGAEAAKVTVPVEKAIDSNQTASEVGTLLGDAFGTN